MKTYYLYDGYVNKTISYREENIIRFLMIYFNFGLITSSADMRTYHKQRIQIAIPIIVMVIISCKR